MTAAQSALRGRREVALLDLPSVARMADILAERCREASWTRTAVASLDRFMTLCGYADLEGLLQRALRDPREAERALHEFAAALEPATQPQIAALALGPKLWFTLNGVAIAWRALPGRAWSPFGATSATMLDRLVLLALVGSGLHRSELLRLRIGDVGALDSRGDLVPEIDADPLAVRYVEQRTGRSFVTFFTSQARSALASELDRRRRAGERLTPDAPLIAHARGGAATEATIARARRFNTSLIGAGNAANVELCRKTGDFFRTWGLPGARFIAPDPHHTEAAP